MSSKFAKLAAKVGSKRLAGYITTHNPKVRARAAATRARHTATRRVRTGGRNPHAKRRH